MSGEWDGLMAKGKDAAKGKGQARNSEEDRPGFDFDSWCSSAGLRSGPASAEVERQRGAKGTKRHPKKLDLSDSTKPS